MSTRENLKPIALGASREEIIERLGKSRFLIIQRVEALLTGDKDPLFRKSRNIKNILKYSDAEITEVFNIVVISANNRLDNLTQWWAHVKRFLERAGFTLEDLFKILVAQLPKK